MTLRAMPGMAGVSRNSPSRPPKPRPSATLPMCRALEATRKLSIWLVGNSCAEPRKSSAKRPVRVPPNRPTAVSMTGEGKNSFPAPTVVLLPL